MQVLVKTLKGNTITVEIGKFDTLSDVKAKISRKIGIPPNELRLMFGGKQLEEEGFIVDQMDAIQAKILDFGDLLGCRCEAISPRSAHPTLVLTSYMIGGANQVFHLPIFSDEGEYEPIFQSAGSNTLMETSTERLRRWRRVTITITASHRFRYTLETRASITSPRQGLKAVLTWIKLLVVLTWLKVRRTLAKSTQNRIMGKIWS